MLVEPNNHRTKEIRVDHSRKFVELSFENFKQRIYLIDSDLIRFRATKKEKFKLDLSWSIDPQIIEERVSQKQKEKIPLSEDQNYLFIETEKLSLKINKFSGCLEIKNKQGQIINQDQQIYFDQETGKFKISKHSNPNEYYYGLGEKASDLEHREKSFVNWNTDASYHKRGTDPFHQTFPFILSINPNTQNHYGIFLDNSFRSHFDFCKEDQSFYSFGAEGGELDYYFFYDQNPKKIIESYTELTGRMPLPPIWSLGYQQSRWSYETERKVYNLAADFEKHDLPLDVIYLDIDYMEDYRSFTINKNTFPSFKKLVKDLLEKNIKLVVIIDPGIAKDPNYSVYQEGLKKGYFIKNNQQVFEGDVWPGKSVFPDFSREEVQKWWGSLYKELVNLKIKGFWNDMNEPSVFLDEDYNFRKTIPEEATGYRLDQTSTDHRELHNLYGMLMSKATFEGLMQLNPQERPFVLTRASFAGGQKFAASWTADNTSSWDYLALWIPMVLNSGLSGMSFNGPDLGGFFENPSAELYTRFLQACIFSPLLRTHTTKFSAEQEPWSFKKEFTEINRKYLKLRYELMPYTYNLFEECSRSGLPIMRPMILEYPDQTVFAKVDQQFLWGESLLIAPVLKDSSQEKEVLLPAQEEWFDFWTGEILLKKDRYLSKSSMIWEQEKFVSEAFQVKAPLEKLPIFVKSNSIIPRQKDQVKSLKSAYWQKLYLDLYLASDFSSKDQIEYSLYQDDGISFEYKNENYTRTNFKFRQASQKELIFESEYDSPQERVFNQAITLKIFNLQSFYKNIREFSFALSTGQQLEPSYIFDLNKLESSEDFSQDQVLVSEDPSKKFICFKFWLKLKDQDPLRLSIKAC